MHIHSAQNSEGDGRLRVEVLSEQTRRPIQDATVSISYTGEPDSTIEQLTTNDIGRTETVDLRTPPLEYSLSPGNAQPYSEYNLNVSAPGYETAVISGVELLEGVTALQEVDLTPIEPGVDTDRIVIGPHTLYGEYPPKIAEAEIKPMNETGEIVLSRVVVPEYVVVHDGPPNDNSAQNYYVRYRDYIKNVASSEIYATWPVNSIRANILAIMSFTLNRVYTEWSFRIV